MDNNQTLIKSDNSFGCGCMILAAGIAISLLFLSIAPVGEETQLLQIFKIIFSKP